MMLPCAVFLYIVYITNLCRGFEVYKADLQAINLHHVPIDPDGNCPTELDMDVYNPLYVVNLQVNCTGSEPCYINFHIGDQLQASVYEICGDLSASYVRSCDSASVNLARVRDHGRPPLPLQQVRCGSRPSGLNPCAPKTIQLNYEGLTPCADFGEASVFMRSAFYPLKMYYTDSNESCSGLHISDSAGTIVSQHTLTPSDDVPLLCQLSLMPPKYPHDLCIRFIFAKFSCSLKVIIENVYSSFYERWDCHTVPKINVEYCHRGNGLGQYSITVTRERNSLKQGFAFNYVFRPIPTTAVTTTQEVIHEVPDSDGPALTSTIAISVSVLVFVSLLYVGYRCFTSKYRPCCRDDDDSEDSPEQENLQNFIEVSAVAENEEGVVPTAPPAERTVNRPAEPRLQTPADGSGDYVGATGSGQISRAPPPCYESLFPETPS